MDHYDAFCRVNFKRSKPYPRPWDPAPVRHGTASLTPDELREVLNRHRAVHEATKLRRRSG